MKKQGFQRRVFEFIAEFHTLGYICLSEGVRLLYSRNKLTLVHKNGVYTFIVPKF